MGDGHLDPGQLITAETTEAAPDECDEVQRMSLTPGDIPVYGAQQAQHQLPPSSNESLNRGPPDDDDASIYVLLDLAALGRSPMVTEATAPGQQIELHDLDTLTPTISLSDGTIAKLIYEDSIGTCLILTEEASAEKPTQLKYLGKTEKLLFVRPEGNRVTPPRFTLQRY